MKNLIRKYREWSFEKRTVWITGLSLCCSTVLSCGKFAIGLFSDYDLCMIAVYTLAIALAKFEYLLAATSDKRPFRTRNRLAAAFLFLASILYVGLMFILLASERNNRQTSLLHAELLAIISFTELTFAIVGIFRTKNKGLCYQNLKIINLCVALIAMLTTQTALLDYTETKNAHFFNSYTGMGVGAIIALCAIYLFLSPKISLSGKERNAFVLHRPERNELIDFGASSCIVVLVKSRVYGSYCYRAVVTKEFVDGAIERDPSCWKQIHILWKIIFCILSEILIPVWLVGRFGFFLRSVCLPKRLERIMRTNGYERVAE